jgi:hypothetical protein
MTRKFHRLTAMALSLIMVLSMASAMASVSVSADSTTPTNYNEVGAVFTSESADAQLPELSNPALAWSGPEALYDNTACGKTEHTHAIGTCSYRLAENGEVGDFGMYSYYFPTEKFDDSDDRLFLQSTNAQYYVPSSGQQRYIYYVWTCGKEEHTHTDACSQISGYKWTVTKSNLNEHQLRHIKVNFTKTTDGTTSDVTNGVTDLIVKASYANGAEVTLAIDSTADDNGKVYTGIHNSTQKQAIISNDTANTEQNHIVGINISYTYNGTAGTYSVNTFSGLEAARLACPNRDWGRSNGLDFTVDVDASSNKYYSKLVKNYFFNDQSVGSTSSDALEGTRSSMTISPDELTKYNGILYGFDKNGSTYENVDLTNSLNDQAKAVALSLNYRRYAVTYEFESATNGKALPAGVKDQLPESTSVAKGDTASCDEIVLGDYDEYKDGVKVGTWTFVGWDKEKVEKASSAVKFVGTWKFTEASSGSADDGTSGNGDTAGKTSASSSPATADSADNISLYIAMILMSTTAMYVTIRMKKREK